MIKEIGDINTNIDEGKLLLFAIGKLMGYEGTKTSDQILNELNEVYNFVFGED